MGIVSAVLGIALSFQIFQDDQAWVGPMSFSPKIQEVYIPAGFDDNDLAQIIVEVEFKDTCEEFGRAIVVPHEEFPNILLVHVEAFKRAEFCTQMINRKIKVIDIGVLPQGDYELRAFQQLDRKLGNLRVRESRTSKIDDAIYAPVDSLFITEDDSGTRNTLVLSGTFPNTCLNFDRVLIAKTKDNVNMLEVLPVVRMDDPDSCQNLERPFLIRQKIPSITGGNEIASGRYLFHVRTMNGGSFNKTAAIEMK